MLKLAGIFAALPTPFDWEGNLYPVKVHHNVARWNRVALAGYLVGGRIGEAAELSIEEKLQLLALVPEAATAGMDAPRLLIAGVGTEGLREGIAISKKAAEMGYQAILADPTGREASLNYFRTLADRSALPVIVVAANAETAIAASQHPNVVAIVVPAEASALNAKSGVSSLKDSVRTGVQVLAGSAANLARDLQDGATAAVLAYSAAAPYPTITIWEAIRTRDTAAAADWQRRIATAVHLVESKYGPAGLKHAMDLNGYYGGPPRLPQGPLTLDAKAEIESAFSGI